MQIAHIMIFEKFNRRYIEFVARHFPIHDHRFYIIGSNYAGYNMEGLPNVVVINSYINVLQLFSQLLFAKRIVLHGLWHRGFIKLLLWQPWLIGRCYWMMWGGDFYYHDKERKDKRTLIRKLRHFVSLVEGDYILAQQWYGAKGQFHRCVLYSYLEEHEFGEPEQKDPFQPLKILVGNSADPSNHHLEVLEQLSAFKEQNIEVIVPLSYGNEGYAQEIIRRGEALLGNRFKPLTDFISLQQYRCLLGDIDIAIFHHQRQQGLGNIIALLAKGKTVYLRPEVTTRACFEQMGITLMDTSSIQLHRLAATTAASNIRIMREHFSVSAYKRMLHEVFYS